MCWYLISWFYVFCKGWLARRVTASSHPQCSVTCSYRLRKSTQQLSPFRTCPSFRPSWTINNHCRIYLSYLVRHRYSLSSNQVAWLSHLQHSRRSSCLHSMGRKEQFDWWAPAHQNRVLCFLHLWRRLHFQSKNLVPNGHKHLRAHYF